MKMRSKKSLLRNHLKLSQNLISLIRREEKGHHVRSISIRTYLMACEWKANYRRTEREEGDELHVPHAARLGLHHLEEDHCM